MIVLTAATIHAGCAREAVVPETSTARDSSGVTIVESTRPSWNGTARWTVGLQPRVLIGVVHGNVAAEQFARIGDATRLPDGRIVVTDASAGEVRYFDRAGEHLVSVGRHGSGPGEFSPVSSLSICRRPDSTLAVLDGSQGRFHVFSSGGDLIATVPLSGTLASRHPAMSSCLPDGTWLAFASLGMAHNPARTISQQRHAVAWVSPHGEVDPPFVQFSGQKFWSGERSLVGFFPIPFTVEPLVAAAIDRAVVGRAIDPELEFWDREGKLRRIARWLPARQQTAQLYDELQQFWLELMPDDEQRRGLAGVFREDLPLPALTPPYQRMLVDATGNTWLEQFRLPGDSSSAWEVVDTAGVWLGSIALLPRLRLVEIGTDYVLAVARDDLGVERIGLYPLLRGPAH